MPIAEISNTPVMQVLPRALDAASLRHLLISANLANAGNPGWQAQELSFEDQLAAVLDRGHVTAQQLQADLRTIEPRVQPQAMSASDVLGSQGINAQVLQMSRNVLHYQALVKSVSAELELLALAASDGRR